MDYRNNQYIVERVVALQFLLQPEQTVTGKTTTALLRLLKKNNQDFQKHVRIIKKLLDQRLLSEEGVHASTQFSSQYEICLKTSGITESFVLFLKPLSFTKPSSSSATSITNASRPSATQFTNPLQSLRSLGENVPKMEIANFQGIVSQTRNPNSDLQRYFPEQKHQHGKSGESREEYHPFDWKNSQSNHSQSQQRQSLQELQKIDLELIEQKSTTRHSQSRAAPPPNILPHNQHHQHQQQASSISSIDWIAPELERRLIIDLIYILAGVNGSHIKYDIRTESYVIDPTLSLQPTVRDMVLYICELGWLYQRVHQYREMILQSSVNTKGLVIQAFAYSLNEELIEYRRLLAVLEQEVQKSISSPSRNELYDDTEATSARYSTDPGYQHLSDFERKKETKDSTVPIIQTGLTLMRLKAWMQEPIERLLLMARLVDCASNLSGGALISRLHAHSRHGDMISSMFVQRIMDSVCTPIFSMLTKWIINGELNDPHKEFFIGQNPVNMIRNLWKDMYYLRGQQIPTFISSTLVEKILNIGKSITFIKSCLEKLPKQTSSTDLTIARRGYRQINKAKKLSLYGVVVDADEEEQQSKARKATLAIKDQEASDEESENSEDANAELSDDSDPWASDEEGSDKETKQSHSLVKFSKKKGKGSDGRSIGNKSRQTTKTTKKKQKHSSSSLVTTVEEIKEFLQSLQDSDDITSTLQSIRSDGVLSFSKLIYSLSNTMDKHLVNLINRQYNVKLHLLALKKFMLLGQGDFVTCLMDNVGPQLGQRASQIFRHNLLSILEGAIRSSNAQYEPSFIIDRLSVRLLESNVSDTGWEVFSLDYIIDLPLNTIVHLDAMMKYRIAFHMLWRLKRVEWSLSTTWKQFVVFSHTHDHLFRLSRFASSGTTTSITAAGFLTHIHHFLQELKQIFHTCHLARGHMMYVVNNFSAFLMFEVMETNWMALEERLDQAKSLNDVIVAHDSYLSQILDHSLLSSQYESLQLQLQQLFNFILRFCSLESELLTDAMAFIARQRILFNATSSTAGKGVGKSASGDDFTDDGTASIGGRSIASRAATPQDLLKPVSSFSGKESGLSVRITENLTKTIADYHNQFQLIMNMLREESERSNDVLRFLTFRLDFNGYHAAGNIANNSYNQAIITKPTIATPVTTNTTSLFFPRK